MPVFPKPSFAFEYDVKEEISFLRKHRTTRKIPKPEKDKLLVATWNVANFGAHSRRDQDRALVAEIISWFDLVALQECRENFGDLFDVHKKLPKSYRIIMSDVAGNNERMVFIYNSKKLTLLEEIGEVTFPPSRYASIKIPTIKGKFSGFDRSPFLASFSAGKSSFMFVNVHSYFGDEKAPSIARRALETLAVAKWADSRKKSVYSFVRELVALGDFNMPKAKPGDPIFDALTKLGLELPEHSTQIASSISSDANYDQVAFLPETTQRCFRQKGVFDYDAVLFPKLWDNGKNATNFKAYLRYYLSDHRPMWVQLAI